MILSGGTPQGGTYYIDGEEKYIFYPGQEGKGDHTIRYEYYNQYGCMGHAEENIYVRNVIAGFTVNTKEIEPGGKIEFTNNSLNSESYIWDYGDGSHCSYREGPYHYYYTPGKYNVVLVAIDGIGCMDTLTKQNYITVKNSSSISQEYTLGMAIYPNPVEDILFIDASLYGPENSLKIEIFDNSGRITTNGALDAGSINNIDVSSLAPGIYYLNMKVDDGSKTLKLIKK